jgi:hypothetical protein
MKLALMAEQGSFGNDEPVIQICRRMMVRWMRSSPPAIPGLVNYRMRIGVSAREQDPMTFSAPSIAFPMNFKPLRVRGVTFALAVVAAMSGPANAAGHRSAGAYDGTWNVVFTTRAGNCSATNSAPFNVSGRQVSSAGGGKVTGGISPNGAVSVRISVGLSAANGNGRLVGNLGAGRWSGIIPGDRCSGTWQATRT